MCLGDTHGEGKLCSLLLMVRENVHATSHGVRTLLLGLEPWTDRGEGKAFAEGCTKGRTFAPFFGSSMLSFQYLKQECLFVLCRLICTV
jgi:hypothetical protein